MITARKTTASLILGMAAMVVGTANGGALDEVNAYRARCGLPPFAEDPVMTEFAQRKARYRAERRLRNGHQGPQSMWSEGTGECPESWGAFVACLMLSDHRVAGAGVTVGADGYRYCVLVCRGGSGRSLWGRRPGPTVRTAHLNPGVDRVGQPYKVNYSNRAVAGAENARSVFQAKAPCPKCGKYHGAAPQVVQRMPCPYCGGYH